MFLDSSVSQFLVNIFLYLYLYYITDLNPNIHVSERINTNPTPREIAQLCSSKFDWRGQQHSREPLMTTIYDIKTLFSLCLYQLS